MLNTIEERHARPTCQTYTIAETLQILKISRTTFYKVLGEGKLASIKIGKCRRIPAGAIDALLREGA